MLICGQLVHLVIRLSQLDHLALRFEFSSKDHTERISVKVAYSTSNDVCDRANRITSKYTQYDINSLCRKSTCGCWLGLLGWRVSYS